MKLQQKTLNKLKSKTCLKSDLRIRKMTLIYELPTQYYNQ